MSLRKFTIEHDRLMYGPYPKHLMEEIEHLSIEVVRISPYREKVTFTIDNKKEEDFYCICYEIGCLTQSFLWARGYE